MSEYVILSVISSALFARNMSFRLRPDKRGLNCAQTGGYHSIYIELTLSYLFEQSEERFPGYIETPEEILKLGYNKTDLQKILDQTLQSLAYY